MLFVLKMSRCGKSLASSSVRKKKDLSRETLERLVKTIADAVKDKKKPSAAAALMEFIKVVGDNRKFSGTEEPTEAEKWLMSIEKVFDVLRTQDENKVRLATYLFEGYADHWWGTMKRLFFSKYFPRTAKALKCAEFATLKQGNMTVTQLDKKFYELECYGDHLIQTKELRARKLEDALKPEIRAKLVPLQLPTYEKVMETALAIEANWVKTQREREESEPKRKNKNDSAPP
ncbi:hypothetical protein MKW98_016021 [Papaver atlanticum]|uniref:Retrotransposon gag domain-containing protein n=1 Tax=Papaver atlanticum TaxID=357466 RepID=A0AAD4X3A6_9MAGN|nr:hypothetical protein MKW98_016021 [Papaver atlanticum]